MRYDTHNIKEYENNILCLHIFKSNARDRTCPPAGSVNLSFLWFRWNLTFCIKGMGDIWCWISVRWISGDIRARNFDWCWRWQFEYQIARSCVWCYAWEEQRRSQRKRRTEANKITRNAPYSKLGILSTRRNIYFAYYLLINNTTHCCIGKNSIRVRELLFLRLSLRECNELECTLTGNVDVRFIDFLCLDSCCFSELVFAVYLSTNRFDTSIRNHIVISFKYLKTNYWFESAGYK